jgi:hypothetical protein
MATVPAIGPSLSILVTVDTLGNSNHAAIQYLLRHDNGTQIVDYTVVAYGDYSGSSNSTGTWTVTETLDNMASTQSNLVYPAGTWTLLAYDNDDLPANPTPGEDGSFTWNMQVITTPYDTTDTLTCGYAYNDADGQADYSVIEWYINSVPFSVSGPTLSGIHTSRGDVIQCIVTPYDGISYGTSNASAPITIGDSLPAITAIHIESDNAASGGTDPSTASVGDTLTCLYTFEDADGDWDVSTFKWYENGVEIAGQTTSNLFLSTGFSGNDTVTCEVTPTTYPGPTTGSPGTADIVIWG